MDLWMTNIPDFHSHSLRSGTFSLFNLLPPFQLPPTSHNYFSAGLHPWYIDDGWQLQMERLQTLVSSNKLKAIGESGLDTLRGPTLELQTRVFETHIIWAKELKLPLILHAVRTHQIILALLKKHRFTGPVIFHGFRSSWAIAKPLVEEGCFLSFGSTAVQPSVSLLETLSLVPLSQLLIETDDAQMPIREILKAVALHKQIQEEKLLEHLSEKFHSFFG